MNKTIFTFILLCSTANFGMEHQTLETIELPFDTLNNASRITGFALYNPNGTQLATYLCEYSAPELEPVNKVMLWDTQTKNCTHTLQQTDDVIAIAYNKNGEHIAVATRDGQLNIWNTQTGTLTKTLKEHGKPPIGLMYTDNDHMDALNICSSGEKTIEQWDVQTNHHSKLTPNYIDVHEGEIDSLAQKIQSRLVHDSHRAFLAFVSDRCVRARVNAKSHGSETIFTSGYKIESLAYNPHYNELAIQDYLNVHLYNIGLKKCIHTISRTSEILSTNYSPDGKHLAVVSKYGRCRLYDLEPLHTLIEKIQSEQ